jgi:spore coat protein A, manganese oxidase
MTDTTRRRILQYGLGAGAALAMPAAARRRLAAIVPGGLTAPLTGGRLRKFREPLPLPGSGIVVATPSGADRYSFTQRQITRRLHPDLPPTPLWAYDDGSGLAARPARSGWR